MFKKIPIAIKIFGIAIIMLLLFMLVAFINYLYLNKVNRELNDIAVHMVPLTEKMTQIGVSSLQQEIDLERILLQYASQPLKPNKLQAELAHFREQTAKVEQALADMQQLSEKAIHYAREVDKIVEYARLEPYLNILAQAYQKTIDRTSDILRLLEQGKSNDAYLLVDQLTNEENDFSQQFEDILTHFIHFIEQSASKAEEHEQNILQLNILFSTLAIIIGFLLATLLIIALTRPIHELLVGTKQVMAGNLNVKVAVRSQDEIGSLVIAFDKMMAGMRQKEQLKATFGQYVDPRIVDLLIQHKKNGKALGQQKIATVTFSDIAGFSGISELLTAKSLVNLINQYLTSASKPITNNHGVIDQFIGDAVVAFWTTPFIEEDKHAVLACFSALEQLEQLQQFRKMIPELLGIKKGLPAFDIRLGIASSPVVAAQFGSENSKSYTIMGNAMVMAEALETANKNYGTTILISEETKNRALHSIETRRIDRIVLPNTDQASNIYELLAKKGELSEILSDLRTHFEQGLIAYEAQDWEKASSFFKNCQQIKADDQPSQYYLTKIENSQRSLLAS